MTSSTKKQGRDTIIMVRLTPKERAKIVEAAQLRGLSLSAFMRMIVLEAITKR
jgi:uncharacterized protein (DUF1778 family)